MGVGRVGRGVPSRCVISAAHLVPILPMLMIGAEEVLGLGLRPPRRTGLPIVLHPFLAVYLCCLQMSSTQLAREGAHSAALGCDISTRDACIVSGLRQRKRHLRSHACSTPRRTHHWRQMRNKFGALCICTCSCACSSGPDACRAGSCFGSAMSPKIGSSGNAVPGRPVCVCEFAGLHATLKKVAWPVSPSRFSPHLSCPAHTSTSLQQFAGPDTVPRSCEALRLGQHNQRPTANLSHSTVCRARNGGPPAWRIPPPQPAIETILARWTSANPMLNGHATARTDDAGVPGPAREGRELQRYSASGERLVAG